MMTNFDATEENVVLTHCACSRHIRDKDKIKTTIIAKSCIISPNDGSRHDQRTQTERDTTFITLLTSLLETV